MIRVSCAVACACVFVSCVGEVRTEDAPIDMRDNVDQLGLYDCSEHGDTGYSQGNAFAITVVTVDGRPVETATANAYIVMQEAAAQDGVDIRIVSGFRTMEQQEYLYGCYVNCNCNNCNLAATPGYSNHQSGHALDLNTSEGGVLSWLNAHGAAYGFERTVPSEAWHWEWWGGGPGGGPCGASPECVANPNFGGCEGTVVTRCDESNHVGSGDCGFFGAACSTGGGTPHCVHPFCTMNLGAEHGGDGENGSFCADATKIGTCAWGAYTEGDCGFYGATCSDVGGAHCVHFLCWSNLDGAEDGSFCHEGQLGTCALGVPTMTDCAASAPCTETSTKSAACVDPTAPPAETPSAPNDEHANGHAPGEVDDDIGPASSESRPMAPSVDPEGCASSPVSALAGVAWLALFVRRRRGALTLACTTALVVGATACTDTNEGRDYVEPIDTRDNVLEQGVYNCTEHTDTGYRQGDAFTIHVVTVDGKPVERDTANAYIVMQEAAAQDGVDIRIVSGFRTMEQQEYLYGCYVNCNCNSCNLAATPGYSNHQSGHALDLNTSEGGVLSWLNNHGDAFGFERTVSSEPWHWEWWGGGPGGGPCTEVPASCVSGDYNGAFCDDEGSGSEAAHDCLVEDLGVDFHCQDVEGSPAYCGGDDATRAQLAFVLGAAADIPLDGHPNGWVDDEGHAREAYLDAFKAYAIYGGFAGGTEVHPDATATRSTIAIVIARMYALPPATQDYFSDDEGSANEEAHNQLGDLGFTGGCGGGKFCGGDVADRSTLARFACGLGERALTPVWLQTPPPNEAPGDPVDPPDDDPGAPTDPEAPPEDEAPPESTPNGDGAPKTFAPSVRDDAEGGCASFEPGSIGALLVLLGAITSTRRRVRVRKRR